MRMARAITSVDVIDIVALGRVRRRGQAATLIMIAERLDEEI